MISERAVISQLEEENNEMLKEVASMEQQLGDGVIPVGGMRDRTVELEAKMKEKQQIRRQLMQQLERLMTQLNVRKTLYDLQNLGPKYDNDKETS